ncbi:hypothetical protein [Methylobacterium oryzihabitans]|uniref:XRE family transcriptional regulator n=1 Tax=Methylobacterium oryzihabitans TaxID=2499852 RepID=A0A3S2V9R4_9HYPH|nr:hypothetical protein [Methylobacterium oryzihabitans]RVU17470.1 hypothetical protein EOE48_13870 [Methylobacterium oryzihabitans]
MKLDHWMKRNAVTPQGLASAMRAHLPNGEGCSAKAVEKWRYGQRTPRKGKMRALMLATAGEVTANDFADLGREAPSSRAAGASPP